ncbi:MAG TPA: disulfide bond formation protein DsbD [Cytophagales bacterium]|nr:disulfide bond formation protein DsbD [Cytophagales bacterium]
MHKKFLSLFLGLVACLSLQAQLFPNNNVGNAATTTNKVKQHSTWKYEVSPKKASVGQEVELVLTAEIEEGWYLYSSDFDPNLGPIVTAITFKKKDGFEPVGKLKAIRPKRKFDDIWGGEISYFVNKAEFRQKIKVLKEKPTAEATIEYQTCTLQDGACVGGEYDFSLDSRQLTVGSQQSTVVNVQSEVVTEKSTEDTIQKAASHEPDTVNSKQATGNPTTTGTHNPAPTTEESLWLFFLKAFLFGLAALLTPCVFPMIPMTVSFFTHSSKSHKQAVRKAWMYGLSIIGIYTVLGTAVAALFGADAANFISTHWLPNLLFFAIFVFFAASFLGMFEIVLPSSLVNKMDAQSEKGGLGGIFFMAFTIALVSFSCTGPIIGTVLIESAGGKFIKPIVGMLGFSTAFAIPFTLFAMFPSWLKSLPKSGGWLNSVKVTLGFLELAFALKFLSQADQVYHWRILDREIFIALWIVIFFLLGLYLLKKIKLQHDDEDYTSQSVSVPRLSLSLVSFAFVAYLVPGMFGAPLKALSGYLPPISTSDFILGSAANRQPSTVNQLCDIPKYAEFLHIPHGLQGYFDLKQAQACAKQLNKPLFIDFTGHGCVNCREMEANVWSDPEVLKRLREDFVIVSLYVDERTALPKAEWYVSPYDGKEKTSIGKQNSDLEIRLFSHNAQPLYVIADAEGKALAEPKSYDKNVTNFIHFLDEGKANFRKK